MNNTYSGNAWKFLLLLDHSNLYLQPILLNVSLIIILRDAANIHAFKSVILTNLWYMNIPFYEAINKIQYISLQLLFPCELIWNLSTPTPRNWVCTTANQIGALCFCTRPDGQSMVHWPETETTTSSQFTLFPCKNNQV